MLKKRIYKVLLFIMIFQLISCVSSFRGIPSATPIIDFGSMDRTYYKVLERVEGTASATNILCGLIKIIDGDTIRLLGLSFNEKYALGSIGVSAFGPTIEQIAYYRALKDIDAADTTIPKGYVRDKTGFPCIYTAETVTFTGKAIQIKTDASLSQGN